MGLDVGIGQKIAEGEEQQRRAIDNALANARFSMPGEIVDFDETKQTATVQPLIKERVDDKWEQLPQLLDVPCFFPRAGGYCVTFPVKPSDECLVIFGDMCLDSWWQSSGVQTQLEMRRHDLSDAMALLGITSVPKAVEDYSTNSMRLRNEDNDAYFEICDDKIMNIYCAETINVETQKDLNVKAAQNINVLAEAQINITAQSDITVKSSASINVESSGDMHLKSSGEITVESGGKMKLKGVKVDINEG